MDKKLISICIPILNEEDNIKLIYKKIIDIFDKYKPSSILRVEYIQKWKKKYNIPNLGDYGYDILYLKEELIEINSVTKTCTTNTQSIFTDIDGTFMGNDNFEYAENIELANKLVDAKHFVIFNRPKTLHFPKLNNIFLNSRLDFRKMTIILGKGIGLF